MIAARRLWALDGADRRLFVRAFVGLIVVDARLRFLGLRRSLSWAESANSDPQPGGVDRARRYADCIARTARHHFLRARCLHQSVLLQRWLRREGIASDLRIGVAKGNEALRAHAWVEVAGEVVNDVPLAVRGFVPLVDAAGVARAQAWL
jgi:transglutaminase superfamily protein